MKHEHPSHADELARLSRIEGQVRGVRKMIEERRYCVDILTQLSSISAALARLEDRVLVRHLRSCVHDSLAGKNKDGRDAKIEEMIGLLARFRRTSGA